MTDPSRQIPAEKPTRPPGDAVAHPQEKSPMQVVGPHLGPIVLAATEYTESFTPEARKVLAETEVNAKRLALAVQEFYGPYSEEDFIPEDYSPWKTCNIVVACDPVVGADGEPIDGGVTFEITTKVNKLVGNAIARDNGIQVPVEEDGYVTPPFDVLALAGVKESDQTPSDHLEAMKITCTIYRGEIFPDEYGEQNDVSYFGVSGKDIDNQIGMFNVTMYADGTWTSRAVDFTVPVEDVDRVSLGGKNGRESPEFTNATMERFISWLENGEELTQEDAYWNRIASSSE